VRPPLLSFGLALLLSTAPLPARLGAHDASPTAAPGDHEASQHGMGNISPLGRPRPSQRGGERSGERATGQAIPLAPRRMPDRRRPATAGQAAGNHLKLRPLATAAASLGMVLGLFFIAAWAMRRSLPAANSPLPPEVFEVLGRAPLAGKQQVYLTRLGHKLLLICLTPQGVSCLGEIDRPDEVERLAGLCLQNRPHSSSSAFREALAEASRLGTAVGQELDGGNRHV